MNDSLSVEIKLANQKVQFSCSARSLPPVTADYFPPLGDGQGYTGLELLLLSLAACSATSVVSMLRRMKKEIVDLRVNASGIRREQHPTSFSRIDLAFTLISPDCVEADLQKAMQLSAETYCPVWAMLKGGVEIVPTGKIIDA
jgi:putative redox protein